jgi:PhnB protein
MAQFNPYLNFPGTTEEAFNLYKSVLGGEFIMVQRFKDIPDSSQVPPEVRDKIMHISLPIGNGNVLMATDALESMGHPVTMGNNFYICISPDSKQEAERIFNGLSQGGKIEMPLSDQFWGAYYGSFRDRFGVGWMINYDKQQRQ